MALTATSQAVEDRETFLHPQRVLVGLVGRGIQLSRTPAMHEAEGRANRLAYIYRLLDTDRMGTFNLELGYSILLTNKFKEFDDQVLTDFRDVPANDGRSRVRGVIGWNKDDWSVNLFGTRFGESTSFAGVDGVDAVSGKPYSERLAPYMLYNLQFGKKFGDNVRADFTIVNVTNNQYREDNSNTAYPFFSPFVGADPAGRRFFLKLNYKF